MGNGGIASAIFKALEEGKALSLDALTQRLSSYTWNRCLWPWIRSRGKGS